MKISVDDVEVFTLNETQKKVIQNDIEMEIFDVDMKRRLEYILMHKYEECFKRLKTEWEPKLRAAGVEMIPTNPDAYAQLVFSQPSYKSKTQRKAQHEINASI
jgi:hypothetical protein